jgi:hypothetical protein
MYLVARIVTASSRRQASFRSTSRRAHPPGCLNSLLERQLSVTANGLCGSRRDGPLGRPMGTNRPTRSPAGLCRDAPQLGGDRAYLPVLGEVQATDTCALLRRDHRRASSTRRCFRSRKSPRPVRARHDDASGEDLHRQRHLPVQGQSVSAVLLGSGRWRSEPDGGRAVPTANVWPSFYAKIALCSKVALSEHAASWSPAMASNGQRSGDSAAAKRLRPWLIRASQMTLSSCARLRLLDESARISRRLAANFWARHDAESTKLSSKAWPRTLSAVPRCKA